MIPPLWQALAGALALAILWGIDPELGALALAAVIVGMLVYWQGRRGKE